MPKEKTQRQDQLEAIKKGATSANGGRSYLLRGSWACRLARGLTQRRLAEMTGGSQTTVRKLERQARGAYPKKIKRLCRVLGVTPEDLLRGGSDKQREAHR